MKVILTTDLKGRGAEGDVIEVARGFAVNYLFPRKMAIQATAGNLKQLEARRHNIEKRELSKRTDAESIASRLQGKTVVVGAKVGEGGRLYGSITPQMVEDAILGQLDVDVDRKKLDVHGHIKTLGEHVVTVSLHRDVKAEVTVTVVAEGEAEMGVRSVRQPAPAEEAAAAEAAGEEDAEAMAEDAEAMADEADEAEAADSGENAEDAEEPVE